MLVPIYMVQKGYDDIDTSYWTIVVLTPVIVMGYWLKAQVASAEAAMGLFYLIELSSTVLLAVLLFSLLRDLGVAVKPWVKGAAYGLAFVQVIIIWLLVRDGTSGNIVQLIATDEGYITRISMGPFWFLQYSYLLAVAILVIGVVFLAQARKKTYSRQAPVLYTLLAGVGVILYAVENVFDLGFTLLPYLYTAGAMLITLIYDRSHSHDISRLVSEQQGHHTARGFVAIGLDGRFLSCNEKGYEFLPALKEQRVDTVLAEGGEVGSLLYGLIDDFKDTGAASAKFRLGEMTCACDITTFSMRKDGAVQGFLIDIRDATQEQRALDILSDYNETLNQEVADKTEHIEQIQRKVVLGMADMVENRDSNTGGHVKRTSDVIQILVEEILTQGFIKLDDTLAHDIVRAAPMHDLGKISIDSSILNKPARLTVEEYSIMKTHSVTSGQIVMILLDGVEEGHFVKTAYHVARYHHERWDGKGYPEGLVGEMIPIEARIMAVADVYDALVSKRVYKEPMSFEEASKIMCEGMGTQFDPNMRAVFLGCRDKLERYYSTVE